MANHGSNIHSIIVACFFALSCSESLASLLDSVEAATMHALSDAEELALRSSHDPVNGFMSRVKKADSRFNAKGAGDVEDSESKSKATTVTGTADSEDVVTIGIPPFKRQKILNLAPHEVQEDEMSDSSSEGPPPLLSGTPSLPDTDPTRFEEVLDNDGDDSAANEMDPHALMWRAALLLRERCRLNFVHFAPPCTTYSYEAQVERLIQKKCFQGFQRDAAAFNELAERRCH